MTDSSNPDASTDSAHGAETYVDSRQLAFYVGLVGLLLGPVMLVGAATATCFHDSISHFYYSRFTGDIFVGALFFIGGFLLAYRSKRQYDFEWWIAKIAGICAFGVALFPTEGTGCEGAASIPVRAYALINADPAGTFLDGMIDAPPYAFFPGIDTYHFSFAAVLLIILWIFCWFIFPAVHDANDTDDDGNLKPGKKQRNRVYRFMGILMLIALVMIGLNALIGFNWWNGWNMMFWMEVVILTAFGISWIIKGRFHPVRNTNVGRLLLRSITD